ncbi:helix-turn-helix domain-containing protein [Pseudovibrio axinellae]|nr:helix-turn-helix domain-containing protein [Pseudovibrio axinellae]
MAFRRPQKLRPEQKEIARDLVHQGKSISAVARTFGVHPATIYRCLEKK